MTTDKPSGLAAIRERCEKATKGPWLLDETPKDSRGWATCTIIGAVAPGQIIYATPDGGQFPENDRRFIAHAREDIPALLDVAEAAAKYRKARKLYGAQSHEEYVAWVELRTVLDAVGGEP